MAKKSKANTTRKPAAKSARKAAPQGKLAASKKSAKKPVTKSAARSAAKAAPKTATKAKSAPAKKTATRSASRSTQPKAAATNPTKRALTPSIPAATSKPAVAAKIAAPTPAAAAPLEKATAPAPQDPALDRLTAGGPLSQEELRKVKTGLTKKDLEHFRQILLEKRAEIIGDVEGLESHRTAGHGEMSHMPLHPADVGSDHYEQEFNLGLMQSEKKLLREIDDALLRIQHGTYGVCFESGKPIPRARLEIKPWAKYTIEVAMEREKRGLH